MKSAVSGSQIASAELVTSSLPKGHRVYSQKGWETKDEEVTEPFIKYTKSESSEFLHKHPIANHVLLIIAYRARRTRHKQNGLQPGQCFMGDHLTIGISRQQYRTAISNLQKWQYITTNPTTKGTVVTLINSDAWDLNLESQPSEQPASNHQPNQQPTITQPSDQPLTKKDKKERKTINRVFAKPEIEELVSAFEEKGSTKGEALNFFNFYSSKNWMVGKNKMTNWKSAVAGWVNRNKQKEDTEGKNSAWVRDTTGDGYQPTFD